LRAALLAAVGHDLRTPLASIKAAVSSLRQGDVTWTADERAEFLATIEDSANRLDDLIANLLAMSRLQAGALSVAPRPVGLDEIVARALIGLRLEVVVDVPDNLPRAMADPGLVERIVANLLVNAHRFSPPGTPVRVEAASGGDVVRLRVIDSGPGVSEEDREQMFSPFQRLGDRSTGGVGLGLAIARGFTEAMNGTLSPSTTPGGGLTMTLTLPAAAS
jgi:K+-sensing histidine kinase KdpD